MDQLPAIDHDLLCRYYTEEPWGAWRDNMHAAIIAREIRLGRTKPGGKVSLDPFLLVHEGKRNSKSRDGLVTALMAMAGGARKHISEVKKRPVRKKVSRGGEGGSRETSSTPRSPVSTAANRVRKSKHKDRPIRQ